MVDGVMTHDTVHPDGPSALMYAWTGPFIGALIRPIGGTISDKIGGAKVTQIISVVMVASALGVAYFTGAAIAKARLESVAVAMLPYIVALFFLLFLLVLVPDITMWLPGVLGFTG